MRHHFSQKLNAFSVPGTRTAKLPALSSTFVVREFLNLTGFVIPRRRISKEIFVSFSGLRGGGVAARGRTQRVVECADKNLYVFRTEGIVMLKKATNRHGASSYSLGGIGKIVSSSKIGTSSRAAQKKSDCLAEDAVRSKTVSARLFPAICDLQGDFQKLQGEPVHWLSNLPMLSTV
jgi:hypothetical protein